MAITLRSAKYLNPVFAEAITDTNSTAFKNVVFDLIALLTGRVNPVSLTAAEMRALVTNDPNQYYAAVNNDGLDGFTEDVAYLYNKIDWVSQ